MNMPEVLALFFGSVFVLFVPGFAWSYVFFIKKHIDWVERLALSFGLSIALVPLTVFWLHFIFRIGITLLNTSLVVCGLTAIPVAYILFMRSSFGRNATQRLKSAFKRGKSGQV